MKRTLLILLIAAWGCPGPKPLEIPRTKAKRIVSLLPSFTEILITIGCKDRLVGVTSFAPPGASAVRSVGGLVDPNLEAIFSSEPDLVLGMRSHSTAHIEKKLGDGGLIALFLRNETLDEAMTAIENIGQVTGQVEEASSLRRKIERELAELGAKVQGAPRPRVAVAVNHDPLILAGRGSFLHELMKLAGGANIAADSKTPHPQFSAESLIARAPEVIIDVSEAFSRGASDRMVILKWDKLPSTPARKNGKIYPLERGIPIDPGPRVALLLRFMARKFHPDRF